MPSCGPAGTGVAVGDEPASGKGEEPEELLGELGADAQLHGAFERLLGEHRAEAEAYERLAARDLLRDRSLAAVAAELCHRGDRVAVRLRTRTITGEVIHAAGDLLSVRTPAGAVDVWLGAPLAVQVLERAPRGGRPAGGAVRSFAARLAELEAAEAPVLLGVRVADGELAGRIEAVAFDHLVLVDPDALAWYVALTAIEWAAPAPLR